MIKLLIYTIFCFLVDLPQFDPAQEYNSVYAITLESPATTTINSNEKKIQNSHKYNDVDDDDEYLNIFSSS